MIPSLFIRFLIYVTLVGGLIAAAIIVREDPFLVLLFTVASLLAFIAGAIYYYLSVVKPVSSFGYKMQSLAAGEIADIGSFESGAEIAEMEKALEDHLNRLSEIIDVLNKLTDGNVVDSFEKLGDNDPVGSAILKLQESIIRSNEEALKRRSYDEQENWASQGLARFGSLFREFDQDTPHFSQLFVNELVKYVDVEVGCLFLLTVNEKGEDEYGAAAAYAFDRVKYLRKTFLPGDGLVGRCALEKQTIVITDVPDDYIKIRSGTGEEQPASIIFIPVIFDGTVLAIIELASFTIIADYKIKFLESLANSMAPAVGKAIATSK